MPLPPPPPPPAAPQELTFYDQFLFRHSPTYNTWARLSAHDIHTRLCARRGFEGQDVWFFLNHPVRWVRVVGVVVACEELENRWCVTVDDGSAYTIDLLLWKNPSPRRTTTATTTSTTATAPKPPPPDLTPITIHTIIKAKGTLTEFRGTKQILLKRVHILPDTNAELRALAEVVEFRRVLGRPWVLPGKLVERERRKLHDSDGGKGKRDKDKGEENAMAMAEKERGVPLQCSSFRGKRREASVVTAKREEGGRKRRREPESEVEIEYPTDAAASTYRGRRRLHKRVAVAVEETIPVPPRRKEEGVEMPSTISTFAPSPSLPERVRQERVKMEYGLGLEVAGAVEDVLGSMAMSTFVPTPVLGGTFRGRRRTVDAFPLPLPSTSALPMEEEEIPVSTMSTFMPTPPLPSPSLPASFQRRRGVNIDTVEDVTETDMDMDIPSSMSSFAPTPTPAAKESYRGRRRAAGSNRVSSSAVSDTIEQTPTLPPLLRLRDSSPVDMPSSISTFAPTQESYRGRRRVRMESRRDTGQDLLATDMPSSISTFAPTQESYCGRRRVKMESRMDTGQDLLSPDMPSSISTFAPTPSLPVLQESYRGRRRGVDVPSSAATADIPPPSSSSVGATYRAQYRAQKALRLEEAAGSQTDIPSTISTFVPTQPEVQQLEERSYLAQRRAAKAKALAEQAEALAKQAEEEYRASKAMAESALGSMSTFVPTQFEPPSPPPPVPAAAATSSYRGRRRVAKAPPSEQSEEPTSSNSRIRYRSSKATDGPEVKTPAAFIPPTTTTTPTLEAEDTYRGRRRRNRAPETPVEEEEPETELPSTMSTFVPTPTPTPMPYSSFATSYFSSYVVSQSQTLPSPSPPPPPPPVPAAVYRGRRRTRPRPAVV